MKYSEIVGVEEHFKSAFDITSDFGDSWKTFISNDKFENNMGQIIKSFTSPVFNNRKSIWVQGTYGTGKSHSLAVIEHLLCDEYENIEDYLPRINKAQIRNEIANFRKEKKSISCCIERYLCNYGRCRFDIYYSTASSGSFT